MSAVTEDWAIRMLTPAKGDFVILPLNTAGQKIGNEWDPAHDQAMGEACKAYAAPALLRIPGRLKISWQDSGDSLRIDTDAGQQTRLLHFSGSAPPAGEAGWQGYSAASWEYANGFDPAAEVPLPPEADLREQAAERLRRVVLLRLEAAVAGDVDRPLRRMGAILRWSRPILSRLSAQKRSSLQARIPC